MLKRIGNRYRKILAWSFYRHILRIKSRVPIISFTFDDFPRSALLVGGAILERAGFRGTFFASMGEMGKDSDVGELFRPDDLTLLISRGHELGCHTFSHEDPWKTPPDVFEQSILMNASKAREFLPDLALRTFAYPYGPPHPRVKSRISRHFSCGRCGGEKPNISSTDLYLLKAVFLERNRERPDWIKSLIDMNREARGWLIFATHDVTPDPSPFGCDPAFFDDIVQYAARSGSAVLTVIQAYDALAATGLSRF